MIERSPTPAPPSSETGVQTTPTLSIGLGWLRGTLRTDPDTVLRLLARWWGDATPRDGGTRWYRRTWGLDDGRVMVAADGIGQAAGTVMVDVRQSALDGIGWDGGSALLRALLAAGVRLSRIDLYCDDRGVSATPSDVWAAVRSGDVVTHARLEDAQRHETNRDGSETVYIGQRTSERMLRVYRKPDDLGDRVRWELETHDDAARHLASMLASLPADSRAPSGLGAVFWGYLSGFVDFREGARAADGNGSRRPRLAWFAALVEAAERIPGRAAAEVVASVDRLARWLDRQAAPALARVFAAYGSDWLNDVLRSGWARAEARGATWASA